MSRYGSEAYDLDCREFADMIAGYEKQESDRLNWSLWIAYNIGLLVQSAISGESLPQYDNYEMFLKSRRHDEDEDNEQGLALIDNFL